MFNIEEENIKLTRHGMPDLIETTKGTTRYLKKTYGDAKKKMRIDDPFFIAFSYFLLVPMYARSAYEQALLGRYAVSLNNTRFIFETACMMRHYRIRPTTFKRWLKEEKRYGQVYQGLIGDAEVDANYREFYVFLCDHCHPTRQTLAPFFRKDSKTRKIIYEPFHRFDEKKAIVSLISLLKSCVYVIKECRYVLFQESDEGFDTTTKEILKDIKEKGEIYKYAYKN
ncbi:MAG: hypothetical protein KAW41_06290 [Candidatus Diapherotrites archaeon]|nr:hypothetical protein [Candidatus Diapherotrites archaeon]